MKMNLYRTKKAQQLIAASYDRLLDEWGVATDLKDIETTYGSTRVIACGNPEAPPLLLLHGVGDDSALMWIYNAAALAPHFRLYAVDTLGGPGKSVPNRNYNHTFDHSVWLDEVLDGLGLAEVNLAGVSHGGYLVQHYTLVRPERVKKAVALAASVPVRSGGRTMLTMMRIFMPQALFPTPNNVHKLLTKLTGDNSAAFTGNPLIVEHFLHLLKGYNNMAMKYHDIASFSETQIGSFRDKVLYLAGNADPFMIRGGKAALEAARMNVRFFDGVGHGINHEIAEAINAIFIEHFTGSKVRV